MRGVSGRGDAILLLAGNGLVKLPAGRAIYG
jgi:hypothetical protein